MTNAEIKKSVARIEATDIPDGKVSIRSVQGVEATHKVQRPKVKATRYPKKTHVLYIGDAGRRVVDAHEWTAENGYVQKVDDSELVERLLRNGDFAILESAPEDPATDKKDGE